MDGGYVTATLLNLGFSRKRVTSRVPDALTTIDLPVVSHVTRATGAEPFLGMMLTLDVRSIVQMASEMDETRPRREDASRSISFEVLDSDCWMRWSGSSSCWGSPHWFPVWRR